MRTYFDLNRLGPETDRRFHAADLEFVDGYVQTVPAVVQRLAPRASIGAWAWSEQQIAMAERQVRGGSARAARERRGLRMQRWWCRQWQRPGGLYRVHELSDEEEETSLALLGPGGIPQECFPRADGLLRDDNDANIVAQVITVGGTLLLTSNMVMVDDELLQRWFETDHNRWPVPTVGHRLVERVDALYERWWNAGEAEREALLAAAVAAFWPDDEGASASSVREATLGGIRALARGHFRRFAPLLAERLAAEVDFGDRVERVRHELPVRMRHAERQRRAMLTEDDVPPLPDSAPSRGASADKRYDW